MNNLTAMAQRQSFDPWSLPDDFTVYAFAPENVRAFLHPHWQTQQAVHPLWSYFFGLYYFVMGKYLIIAPNYIFNSYEILFSISNRNCGYCR